MSHDSNTNILEQVQGYLDSVPEDSDFIYQVNKAMNANDLDEIQWLLHNYCELCGEETTANCNNANCLRSV